MIVKYVINTTFYKAALQAMVTRMLAKNADDRIRLEKYLTEVVALSEV